MGAGSFAASAVAGLMTAPLMPRASMQAMAAPAKPVRKVRLRFDWAPGTVSATDAATERSISKAGTLSAMSSAGRAWLPRGEGFVLKFVMMAPF